jgi:hypothetical protein
MGLVFSSVGFEVLTAVSTRMAVFWVVALCCLVELFQRFLLLPSCRLHGATTQKTAILVFSSFMKF